MADLSTYRVTGPNNPNKQISVDKWNSLLDAVGGIANTYGYYENAAVRWAIANGAGSSRPQVLGITDDSQLATYADRDSVAFYAANVVPSPIQSVAAISFTATTVTLAASANSSVVVGMVVDTSDATKFSGKITGISADRLTLTVSGWFQMGNTAAGQVPTGTPTIIISPITKAWALNANIYLNATSYGSRGSGVELGVVNNKGAVTYGDGGSGPTGGVNLLWGYDVVNLGTYRGGVGFIQRGDFLRGFVSRGANQYGFTIEDSAQNPAVGFVSEATTGKPFSYRPNGVESTYIGSDGGFYIGKVTTENGFAMAPVTAGSSPSFKPQGVDATIHLHIGAKGTGVLAFGGTGVGNESLRVNTVASAVNQVRVTGSIAGAAVEVAAGGSDGNIDLKLTPKGSGGRLQVGQAFTAAASPPAFTATHYLPIKDSGGTTYYMPVRNSTW